LFFSPQRSFGVLRLCGFAASAHVRRPPDEKVNLFVGRHNPFFSRPARLG